MADIALEYKGHINAYAVNLWNRIYKISDLLANNNIGKAYTSLMALIPLLPPSIQKEVKDKIKSKKRNVYEKIKATEVLMDSHHKYLIKQKLLKKEVKKLVTDILTIITKRLDTEGYLRYISKVEVGGEKM